MKTAKSGTTISLLGESTEKPQPHYIPRHEIEIQGAEDIKFCVTNSTLSDIINNPSAPDFVNIVKNAVNTMPKDDNGKGYDDLECEWVIDELFRFFRDRQKRMNDKNFTGRNVAHPNNTTNAATHKQKSIIK